jgi:hypothetical protein
VRRLQTLLVVALAAAALASPASIRADEPEEWERDAPPDTFFVSPVDAEGHRTHVVLRIVDDVTGDPLPGATVALHGQTEYPITGLVGADRTGIADEDGWVRIRMDDMGFAGDDWRGVYWKYVEAPGHAGAAVRTGDVDGEIRLQGARDALVQVRDALDRPVGGATVGVRVSSTCGHMNDQRIAVSDFDGLAVVPGLCSDESPDWNCGWEAWTVSEGIRSEYHDVVVPLRRSRPQVLRHLPSRPIEGVVVDHEGKPLAGAHVGVPWMHRGPWTETDSAGRFRLVGAPLGLDVEVVEEYPGMYAAGAAPTPKFTPPPNEVSRVFRMPPPGKPMAVEPLFDTAIVARDAETRETHEDAPLVAFRDGDGWTTREDGEITRLPAGSFTVLAGGGLSPYAEVRARVEVKDGPPAPVSLDLKRHPGVRVAWRDDPERVSIALVSADDERDVEEEVLSGAVSVPPGVECAFRVSQGRLDEGHVEYVPVPVEGRGAEAPPIVIHATRAAVVKARLAGPDGEAVPGRLVAAVDRCLRGAYCPELGEEYPAHAEPSVSLLEGGDLEVLAVPEGKAFLPRIVAVHVPAGARGGAPIDLGTIRLVPRGDRRLTVLRANGDPATEARIRWVRDGVARWWHASDESNAHVVDPDPVPLAEGDEVEATARWEEGDFFERTIRMRLSGTGPWTLRGEPSRGSVAVDATDEEGKPLEASLVVDGRAYEGMSFTDDAGKRRLVEVTGLAPGPHRIAAFAKGRVTRLYRVVLKEGERRVLRPTLRPVPPVAAPPK